MYLEFSVEYISEWLLRKVPDWIKTAVINYVCPGYL